MEEARRRLEEYSSSLEKLRNLRVADINELWIEYDRQSDTLYIGFGKEEADESIMVSDDITVLLKGDMLVGVIVSNFSSRM